MKENAFLIGIMAIAILAFGAGCSEGELGDSMLVEYPFVEPESEAAEIIHEQHELHEHDYHHHEHDHHPHEHEHDHSVEIEGRAMRLLTVRDIAELWEIDADVFLSEIVAEVELKGDYSPDTVLEVMRMEHKFAPAIIKDIAEDLKAMG